MNEPPGLTPPHRQMALLLAVVAVSIAAAALTTWLDASRHLGTSLSVFGSFILAGSIFCSTWFRGHGG